jgi:hypothetical protein
MMCRIAPALFRHANSEIEKGLVDTVTGIDIQSKWMNTADPLARRWNIPNNLKNSDF